MSAPGRGETMGGGGERTIPGLPVGALVARDGALPLEDGLPMLADLLERLAALHRAGQAHGALGPETVLATFGAEPGVALELAAGMAPPPAFLSPERAVDAPATREADVWAAGALAHLLLAGRPPVAGANGEVEALALAVPGVPFRLGVIVDRMLSSAPGLRPSAAGAAGALKALREAAGLVPPPEPVASPPAEEPSRPAGWLGGLIKRKAPPPAKAAAPAPARPRAAGNPSLALLCLDDLEPIPRVPVAPPRLDLLQAACAATAAESVRIEDLPAFPSVALEVVELARREDVAANDLVRLINQDPALIARVLRIANSVYANRGLEVTSAREAVTRLGLDEVASIAATAATRALFVAEGARMPPALAEASRRAWVHALTSALSASWLAMECHADASRAFLGGMLHDIGKLVALRGLARVIGEGRLPELDPAAAVGPVLAATHVDLGVRMARAWALPTAVIRACAEHHRPEAGPKDDRELHLVRVVSGLASLRVEPDWSPDRVLELQESATLLGFDRFRVRATAAQVRTLAARAEALAQAAG